MNGVPVGGFFVGRHAELEGLGRALADASAHGSRFVLVTGERGIGRTSLLQRFLAGAGNVSRVTGSGEQSETLLPYGLLEQLARSPVPAPPFELPLLTAPSSSPHDPVAMATALLELLRALERREPVVLVVDDAHVADEPSLLALLFAFRRLNAARLLAIISAPDDKCAALPEGLRRLVGSDAGTTVHLEGFDDRVFREFISGLGVGPVSPALSRRLRDHCGGNRLHARTVIQEVSIQALHRLGALPWPAPESLRRVVLDRLAACPPAARRLVAAAAVMGMRCQLTALQQLGGIEQPLAALQAAIDHGLVEYQDREVAFSCPLVRGAVYHGLALSERAELHARAAALVEEEGAALCHRAAAAADLDGGLASEIAAFARREGVRGDWAGAAGLFEEAAMLCPPGRARELHVLEAVECNLLAGDLLAAASAGRDIRGYGHVARSHYLLGRVAAIEGRHEEARRLLTRALDACHVEADRPLESKVAVALASLNAHLLRPTEAISWAERAVEVASGTPLAQGALPYLAFGLALTGQADRAVGLVGPRSVRRDDASDHEWASELMAATVAFLYAGALDMAWDRAAHLVSVASRSGLFPAQATGLGLLAFTEYRLGSWNDALEHAELGISLADGAGLVSTQSLVHSTAAWVRAGRGEWGAAEAHVRRAAGAARCPSDIALASMADAAVGRARDQHRRVVEAVDALRAVGAPRALDEPGGLWPWHEVYVDALIALGLLAQARHELECVSAVAAASGAPSTMVTALRLQASVEIARGRTAEADEAFRTAICQVRDVPEPFNQGLLHAAYGAFLRRRGSRAAAATELKTARTLFARLGASPFFDRCDRELASTRRSARRLATGPPRDLTPREASVARLVCEGKRNREVATQLVVSENTVEYHLKHIYAKLGIASRSQLIVRLGARSAETGPSERSGSHSDVAHVSRRRQ